MRLHLIAADATKIVADLQFVKHFEGLFGGAEGTLDKATGGSLQSTIAEMESNRFLLSRIVGLPQDITIGSKNLLILNLGNIRRFTLNDLDGAIGHATMEALKHGFKKIATPVIGISGDVGLPIERAYRTVLGSFLSTIADSEKRSNSFSKITDITIFDFNSEKVDFFCNITKTILTELGVKSRRLTNTDFELQVGSAIKQDFLGYTSKVINTSNALGEIEKPEVIKVLFLAANPRDTQPLRLNEEIREIDLAFRQAEYRNLFDIRQQWAVRVMDLQSHLLHYRPKIVHFSGHGNTASSILLEDINGNCQAVPPRALGRLFSVLRDNIRCVVLNACYSEVQAIAEHIDCVIGMTSAVSDKAAINFASAFYQALGYGWDVQTAFNLGCVQIEMEGLEEQDTPRLIAKRLEPKDVRFVKNP